MFKVNMKQIDATTKVARIIQTWPDFDTKEEAQAFVGGNGPHHGTVIVSHQLWGKKQYPRSRRNNYVNS
jgi:hypothetical protein